MAAKRTSNRGLGRGLSALMADVSADEDQAAAPDAPRKADMIVPVEKITPNPDQPRRRFSKEQLEDLAASIREKGIIQPLIVRNNPHDPDGYEIVAGERRWRAAQLAQLHEVPVLVRDYDDTEALEVAIIENIQRADLNPVEEAAGYRDLMDRFGHTQEKLAGGLGKSRSHIANLLRLLQLPEDVQDMLRDGRLTAGHARALVTSEDPSGLAQRVVTHGLSVREVERLVKKPRTEKVSKPGKAQEKDADTVMLEKDLSASLGMRVEIDHQAGGETGKLTVHYRSLDDLDELCRRLSAVISPSD